MPSRVQRFFLLLLKYNFVLQYLPCKQLVLADMLSRSTADQGKDQVGTTSGTTDDVEIHAVQSLGYMVTYETQRLLQQETSRDVYLQTVRKRLRSGQPVNGEVKLFAKELSVVNGIVLKGSKVVIPKSMRQSILNRIHAGHLGLQKCKERARTLVFWPGLNGEIAALVESCATCRKYAYRQPHEPLQMRPVPKCAWYRVGVDIFSYAGNSYVVAYDAFSNFPEVEKLDDTTAATTIAALSAMFARYGVPVEVCTDNGPQFSSHEFARFAKTYDFSDVTSSPRYPQSNGLAEKGVQIVKRILKKTREAREDFWLGLLAYRSTPLEDGHSPGELLQKKRLLCSDLPDFGRVSPVRKHHQAKAGKPLPILRRGTKVRLQDATSWSPKAKVVGETAPRSYLVRTQDHRVLRRNRRHLLRTGEQHSGESDDDCEEIPPCESSRAPAPAAPAEPTAQASEASSLEIAVVSMPPASDGNPSPGIQPTHATRSSTRVVRPPQKLHYDKHFQQVS
nr:uncharacterized protein K02A2.6-like [Dermacentor andersoni]